jgi:hypothetical protein
MEHMSTRAALRRPVVYLHIGEPKSGTTYLQEIVWSNRDELLGQGLHLLGERRGDQFRASQDLRGVPMPPGSIAPSWVGEWDAFAREAVREPRRVLISQEHLCGATPEQAKRALDAFAGAEVHVIITVRDFVSLLPAEWQETVKHRNQRDWSSWLADITAGASALDEPAQRMNWFWRAHDTPAILRRWTVGVPDDRVHVVTVPRSRTNPTLLWERFAGILGVDPRSVDTTRARANATLGIVETELLRRLNGRVVEQVPQWFYAAEVKGHVAHKLLAERPPSARPQLPAEYVEWAHQRGEQVIEELAASRYQIVGDLAELRAPKPDGATSPPQPDPTDSEVLDAALDTIAKMLRDEHTRHMAELKKQQRRGKAGQVAAQPDPVRRFLRRHPKALRIAKRARAVVRRG